MGETTRPTTKDAPTQAHSPWRRVCLEPGIGLLSRGGASREKARMPRPQAGASSLRLPPTAWQIALPLWSQPQDTTLQTKCQPFPRRCRIMVRVEPPGETVCPTRTDTTHEQDRQQQDPRSGGRPFDKLREFSSDWLGARDSYA